MTDTKHATLDARTLRRWQQALMQTAWGRTHIRPVALEDGDRLLASAMQYDLVAVLDGRQVRTCGVGAVLSHDDPTGASACALVDQVLDRAAAAGAELCLVFSPLETQWVQRRGLVDITPKAVRLTIAELRRPGTPMMPTRAGEDRDLTSIADMGAAQAARFRFHLTRDVDFIQHALISRRLMAGLQPQGVQELNFAVAEEGGGAAAYVVLTASPGLWTLHECGDRDPTGARVGAILQALLARDPTAARPVIRGALPPGFVPPQVSVAADTADGVVLAGPLGAARWQTDLAAADTLYWPGDMY